MAPEVVETLMWQGVPEEQRQAFFAMVWEQLPVKRMGSLEDMQTQFFISCRTASSRGQYSLWMEDINSFNSMDINSTGSSS